jgi:hypothetical protein
LIELIIKHETLPWNFKNVLLREILWSVIDGISLNPIISIHQSTSDSKDKKKRVIIFIGVKDIQKVHVNSRKIINEIWDALKNQFQV